MQANVRMAERRYESIDLTVLHVLLPFPLASTVQHCATIVETGVRQWSEREFESHWYRFLGTTFQGRFLKPCNFAITVK